MALVTRKYVFRLIGVLLPYFPILFFLAATILLFLLPVQLRRQNYFSENSLMVNVIRSEVKYVVMPAHWTPSSIKIKGERSLGFDAIVLLINAECPQSMEIAWFLVNRWIDAPNLSLDIQFIFQSFSSKLAWQNHTEGTAVRAAVAIDICSTSSNSVCLNIVGHNGMLPNLDFVNVITYALSHESLQPRLDCAAPEFRFLDKIHYSLSQFFKSLTVMANSHHHYAVHAPLRSAGIHSVTLSSRGNHGKPDSLYLRKFASSVEIIIRSMNNLNERLHHSYFLYYPLSTGEFIDNEQSQNVAFLLIAALTARAATVSQLSSGWPLSVISITGAALMFTLYHCNIASIVNILVAAVSGMLMRWHVDEVSFLTTFFLLVASFHTVLLIMHPALSILSGGSCCIALLPINNPNFSRLWLTGILTVAVSIVVFDNDACALSTEAICLIQSMLLPFIVFSVVTIW